MSEPISSISSYTKNEGQEVNNIVEGDKVEDSDFDKESVVKERRFAPHWSLLSAGLIIFAFLLYSILPYLNPVSMSIAMLILLYPSRRIRAIKPFLVLTLLIFLIAVWWRLSTLLTPFIIAFIIAYALNPLVDSLQKRGLPRLVTIFAILIILAGVLFGIGLLVIPRLWSEISLLATTIPNWIEEVRKWGEGSFIPWLWTLKLPMDSIWGEVQPRLPNIAKTLLYAFTDWSGKALSGFMNFIAGLFNVILIPIVTIYVLNDFGKIKRWVYSIFPDDLREDALKAYRGLNTVMSGFIRGQLLVCLFLATWIGLGLVFIAQIPYGLLLGAAAGLLNLLPYVGTTVALIITLLVSLFNPDPIWTSVKALIVFVTAQTLEGNFVTPRLVGDRVGLHPLLVIFLVLLFATLFGFIGMLIAIPVGAGAKVLLEVWNNRQKRIKSRIERIVPG